MQVDEYCVYSLLTLSSATEGVFSYLMNSQNAINNQVMSVGYVNVASFHFNI